MASAWVPHSDRMFFLNFLHHAVLNFEMGIPISTVIDFPTDTNSLEHRHDPLCASSRAYLERTKDAVVEIDTLACPPQSRVHPLETVINSSQDGVPTLRDPRYLSMLHELDKPMENDAKQDGRRPEERARLAMCVGFCGLYKIYIFGRFRVTKWVDRTRVDLLNGYVKVGEKERLKVKEQVMPSMEQHSLQAFEECAAANCERCQTGHWPANPYMHK